MSETDLSRPLSVVDSLSFKIAAYFADYKRLLILIVPLFLMSLALIFKFSSYDSKAEADFLSAKNAYAKWIVEKKIDGEHFDKLKQMLKKHPELKPFYETGIIQQCLAMGQVKEAEPFVADLLKRGSINSSSYYHRFAEGTFLIEKGTYDKAYEEALLLKQDLLSDQNFWERQKSSYYGSALFLYNLLRIGMLSERLEKREEELFAWKELKSYVNWDGLQELGPVNFDRQAVDFFLDHFKDQSLSIKDYIKHRENL